MSLAKLAEKFEKVQVKVEQSTDTTSYTWALRVYIKGKAPKKKNGETQDVLEVDSADFPVVVAALKFLLRVTGGKQRALAALLRTAADCGFSA